MASGPVSALPSVTLVVSDSSPHEPAVQPPGGKHSPAGGNPAADPSKSSEPRSPGPAAPPAEALLTQLNKVINDSGRPDRFKIDPASGQIQQINPATGEIVGVFSAAEFPALAYGLTAAGTLLDSRA